MSFREKLLDYCENTVKLDCPYCPFKVPCDRVSEHSIPKMWDKSDFDLMEYRVSEYQTEISCKLKMIEDVLDGE